MRQSSNSSICDPPDSFQNVRVTVPRWKTPHSPWIGDWGLNSGILQTRQLLYCWCKPLALGKVFYNKNYVLHIFKPHEFLVWEGKLIGEQSGLRIRSRYIGIFYINSFLLIAEITVSNLYENDKCSRFSIKGRKILKTNQRILN